ncbi:MAG: efflux transporter outer membrane subunit [Hyphomonadaceae bacterium]
MARIDRLTRGAAAIALMGALSACSLMPSERPTPGALPEAWQDAPAQAGDPASLTNWWRGFEDPMLDRLVAEALSDGGSVLIAASRVREARAQGWNVIAGFLPRVDGFGRGTYNQSLDGPDLPTADLSGAQSEQMIGSYGAQVSWEIPMFGRIAAAGTGAGANVNAARADLRGAQVALAADTAQAYVDLRAAQQSRIALAEAVQLTDQLAGILRISADNGFASEADAADVRRQAEVNRARLPNIEIEARRAERILSVLRGHAPGTEEAEVAQALTTPQDVPSLELEAAPAMPADFVRLRPDVAQAEAQALIAAAQLGSARWDLLPSLNLTGTISATDNLLGDAVASRTAGLQLIPFINIPLLGWGQRLAQVTVRDAQFDQAMIRYRDTVNGAINEGAMALTSLEQGRLRLNAARAAEEAAEITARGSRAAYEAGIQSLADRLRNEQQLIDARLTRISAEQQYASAAITVYRAFGGGPG